MKKRIAVLAEILMVLSGFGLFALLVFKNAVIIQNGIVFYRNFTRILASAFLFSFFLCFLALAKHLVIVKQDRKNRNILKKKEEELVREKSLSEAGLSLGKKLDGTVIRKMLVLAKNTEWKSLSVEIDRCLGQMDQMDDYQKKLEFLLAKNDAGAWKDTEDVLDQVEQYLYRNIRKVLNYLNVLNSSDMERARIKLEECIEDNDSQLSQVQEFLLALTDLLNMQGSGNQEIETLEMYKDMILRSVQKKESGF